MRAVRRRVPAARGEAGDGPKHGGGAFVLGERGEHQYLAAALAREEGHSALFEQPVDRAQQGIGHGVGDRRVVSAAAPGRADRERHHAPELGGLDAVVVHPLPELRRGSAAVHEHVQEPGPRAAPEKRHVAPGRRLDLEEALRERQRLVRELGDQALLRIRGHQDLLHGAARAHLAERDVPAVHLEDGAGRPAQHHRLIGVPGVARERVAASLGGRHEAPGHAARRREEEHGGAQQLADAPDQPARVLLGEQHLEQLLLQGHAPTQAMHVTRGKRVEDVTGDLAEGRALGNTEQRQLLALGRCHHLRRDRADVRHDGHPDADHAALPQQLDEPRRRGGILFEARSGGEQQAPPDHPRRRILEVADVDRLDGPVDPGMARDDLQAEPARRGELADREGLVG